MVRQSKQPPYKRIVLLSSIMWLLSAMFVNCGASSSGQYQEEMVSQLEFVTMAEYCCDMDGAEAEECDDRGNKEPCPTGGTDVESEN